MASLEVNETPNVLIIPDGNRRWARKHDVDFPTAYDRAGELVVELTRYMGEMGSQDTWFGISRPLNHHRDPDEFRAVYDATMQIHDIAKRTGQPINVHAAGGLRILPQDVREMFEEQAEMIDPGQPTAHLLFNWSSSEEVLDLYADAQRHPGGPNDRVSLISKSAVNQKIQLVIRTGFLDGSQAWVSDMVPWHSGDAVMQFPRLYFPDFDSDQLAGALKTYRHQEHRNQMVVPPNS